MILWLVAAAVSASALGPKTHSPEAGVAARAAGQLPAAGIERWSGGEAHVKLRVSGDAAVLRSVAGPELYQRPGLLVCAASAFCSADDIGPVRGRAPPLVSVPQI